MSLPQAHSGPEPGADQTVRVMVVDDSAVARGLISRWVGEDPALTIVGKASNGLLAVENAVKYAPDVIVLDIEMPVMDGMTALPELLKRNPGVKVIMASTLTRRNAEISLRALSLGAVDYIPKPESNSGITTSTTFREDLVRKIRAVGGVPDEDRPVRQARPPAPEPRPAPQRREPSAPAPAPGAVAARPRSEAFVLRPFSTTKPAVLAIGSSTGGPKALAEVFAAIAPRIRSIPVLVTQHMPATFTTILAEHVAKIVGAPCKEAQDGEPLRAGVIYIAPGGFHMGVQARSGGVRLKVYDGPQVNYCKPAVDPLFSSIASVFGPATLAAVLTGMGHDGCNGAADIARAGGTVIAQDQATSVVWGMPRAALDAGACAAVLPLKGVASKINDLLSAGGRQ